MSTLNWAQWTLIGLLALGAIVGIVMIGKERQPRTPAEATIGLLINVGCIWLVVEAGS
jgi:hypothetical protein